MKINTIARTTNKVKEQFEPDKIDIFKIHNNIQMQMQFPSI